MPRKTGLLHVRKHLEWVAESCRDMLERDGKYPNGLRLAPIDQDNICKIAIVTEAILRKHTAKQTRKDVYLEARP